MLNKKYWLFFFSIVLLFLILAPLPSHSGSTEKGQIKIAITGFKSNKGKARYGLFNSKDTFLKKGQAFRKGALPIKNKKFEFIIDNVPYGEYTFAVGHDLNDNGKIERFFQREPSGISNYKKKLYWWPKYEKAKFVLDSIKKSIEIKVF